jgi:hypothetical protein
MNFLIIDFLKRFKIDFYEIHTVNEVLKKQALELQNENKLMDSLLEMVKFMDTFVNKFLFF